MNKIFLLLLISFSSLMAADKPNIVLILSDDQAWNDYNLMAHEQYQRIRQSLAKQTVDFQNKK